MSRRAVCAWLAIVAQLIDAPISGAVSAAWVGGPATPAPCGAVDNPGPAKPAPVAPSRHCALCLGAGPSLTPPRPGGGPAVRLFAGRAHPAIIAAMHGAAADCDRICRSAAARSAGRHPNRTVRDRVMTGPARRRCRGPADRSGGISMSMRCSRPPRVLLSATSAGAMAQGVEVTDAWARATPGGAQAAAAYATPSWRRPGPAVKDLDPGGKTGRAAFDDAGGRG